MYVAGDEGNAEQVSDGEGMGGAVIALGLSGANVSLGFLSGFIGLRYLGHVRTPLKIGGAAP